MKRLYPFVLDVIRANETNNPFTLASNLGIKVKYKVLPNAIGGLYLKAFTRKVIIINKSLSHNAQAVALAHELGHFLLRHKGNSLIGAHILPQDRLDSKELQANKFAFLLIAHTCLRNKPIMIDSIRDEKMLSLSDTAKLLDIFECENSFNFNIESEYQYV